MCRWESLPHMATSCQKCTGLEISRKLDNFVPIVSDQTPLSVAARTMTGTVRSLIPVGREQFCSFDLEGTGYLDLPGEGEGSRATKDSYIYPERIVQESQEKVSSIENQYMLSKPIT